MHKAWLIFAQCIAALVVVAAGLLALDRFIPGLLPFNGGAITIREVASAVGAPHAPSTFADAAARSRPSVVNIFTSKQVRTTRPPYMDDPRFRQYLGERFHLDSRPQRVSSLGSGVIVSENGYILTNNHVVEAADEIQVVIPEGRTVKAELVGSDPDTDLAVLKVERSGLPAISFAKPDALRVGDVVLAIGNPFGVGQTVTMGIVSGLGRSHLGVNTFESYIQTDAAINPGNSGGALVDAAGNLIGINTVIYSRYGTSLGIGFAIPVSIVRQVMEQIIAHGTVTRGWVGIEVQEITQEIAESFNLKTPEGALIAGVLRGGPADRAGIRPGDILVGVGGKPVVDSTSLLNLIAVLPPGKVAQLKLKRDQTEMQILVTVEKRPVMRKADRE